MVYTIREAAAELGISAGLLYTLVAERRIRHERHGRGRGKILIPAEALLEYRRGVTVQPVSLTPPAPVASPVPLKHLSARRTGSPRPAGARAAGSGGRTPG